MTDISFKNIWTTNISYKTKETIWKYLQTFCLLALNHQSNKQLADALNDLSDNKEIELKDKKIASDVKKIKKMTENIKEPIAEEINKPPEPENPFQSIMGNTEIGKLAEEVSNQIDLESMLGSVDSDNPMEIFQNLMSGGHEPNYVTIHNVVNSKVDKGELSREGMMSEATKIFMESWEVTRCSNKPTKVPDNHLLTNHPRTNLTQIIHTKVIKQDNAYKETKGKTKSPSK